MPQKPHEVPFITQKQFWKLPPFFQEAAKELQECGYLRILEDNVS